MAIPSLRETEPEALLRWAGALVRFLDAGQRDLGNASFALDAATTSLIIPDQVVTLGAGVFLQSRNAAAALLFTTSPGIFVDLVIDGSFQVTYPTAAGGEEFGYLVIEQDGDEN